MPESLDGARNALSGFLFQVIVDIGLTARALRLTGVSDTDEELEAILSVIRDGQINEELFGQDAVLRSMIGHTNPSCILIQYKYSRQLDPPHLGREALIEIVDKLYNSGQESTKAGYTPTSFVLLTNRPIGPTASRLVEDAKNGLRSTDLEQVGRQDVLSRLVIPKAEEATLNTWFTEIKSLGMRYGASPREISDWLNFLFGQVAAGIAAGASPVISKQVLLQTLLEHGEARALLPMAVVDRSEAAISARFRESGLQRPLRREIINEIAKKVSEHALVVLYGDGGSGKTVSLLEWAHECVSTNPPDERVFTGVAHATEVDNQWVAHLVAKWMDLPAHSPRCQEDLETTLNRLLFANAGLGHPILRLAVDGLDECLVEELRSHVQDIIRWFLQENTRIRQEVGSSPRATLIVTCRAYDVMDQVYFADLTGRRGASAEVPRIQVPDFSDDELLRIAEQSSSFVQSLIMATLLSTANNEAGGSLGPYPLTLEKPFYTGALSDARVIAALRHPGMWGAFEMLPEPSQIAALKGDETAIAEMAGEFRGRFYRKLVRREKAQGLGKSEFHHILTQIANRYNQKPDGQLASKQDWTDAACATGHVSPVQARELYTEALSGGLIAESSPSLWYWKHLIMVMDLLAGPEIPSQSNP